MASDLQAVSLTYACRCLNVRITTTVSSSERPSYSSDPNYSSVFVNDDGIQVNHPQATVRLMSKPVPVPGLAKHSQFTALTCLFCALPAYRVHHIISLEVEGNTSTFLPSEEWVEKEILKSGTGWIDVHKDCLTRDDVVEALSAPSYVSLFAMALPATLLPPPSPESHDDTGSSNLEDENSTTHLPAIPPVFLPPPFTPSNQVFTHLADVANTQSDSLRSAAEERIQNFIKAEVAEILEKETIIKNQVLRLWKEFKQHLGELQLDMSTRKARSPTRHGDHGPNGFVSTRGTASTAIRSFSPTHSSSSTRHAMSPSQPRISALSASLATSTFHYPEESQVRSPEIEWTSPESSDDQTLDSHSVSSTLVQSTAIHGEEANVLQFRRTINDDIDTQASYRYFALEAEMELFKHTKELESNKGEEHDRVPQFATSEPPAEVDTHRLQTTDPTTSEGMEPQNGMSPPRGRDKGKRKVTFDVKPAVVAIEKAEKAVVEPVAPDQETIFRLDDMASEAGTEVPANNTHNTLPLIEQPPPRPITIKRRSFSAGREAFQSLRPASLPPPSHIRPIRSPPGVDSSHIMHTPVIKAPSPTKASPKVTKPSPLNENEKHLLKLVAADTPSHRGAWNPGSDNWNMITGKSSQEGMDAIENDEEDDDHTAQSTPTAIQSRVPLGNTQGSNNNYLMVGSLPVNIKRIELPKPLSLASYVGQDALPESSELVAPTVNGKKQSASSIRKAIYLEKDLVRAIDPGPLDSVMEDDDVEDDEDVIPDGQFEGEKARLQALRILQVRSKLPEEGMWRSLA